MESIIEDYLEFANNIGNFTIKSCENFICTLNTNIGEIHIWDIFSGETYRRFENNIGIISIAFSKKYILGGSSIGYIKIFDVEQNKLKEVISAHESSVHAIEFLEGGSKFITGSVDTSIKIWDTQSYRILKEFYNEFPIIFLNISQDEKYISVSGYSNNFSIWNIEKNSLIKSFDKGGGFLRLYFSPTNKYFFTKEYNNVFKLYHTKSGRLINFFCEKELRKIHWKKFDIEDDVKICLKNLPEDIIFKIIEIIRNTDSLCCDNIVIFENYDN